MDGYGRLLIHPLLPQLNSLTVDTPLADLTDIEYDIDDNISRVRQGMLSYVCKLLPLHQLVLAFS